MLFCRFYLFDLYLYHNSFKGSTDQQNNLPDKYIFFRLNYTLKDRKIKIPDLSSPEDHDNISCRDKRPEGQRRLYGFFLDND